jgi:hypothetical protein
MKGVSLCLCAVCRFWTTAYAGEGKICERPGCADQSPKQFAELTLDAMGGRNRLEARQQRAHVQRQNTLLAEQSCHQEPFITLYYRA